MKPLSLALPLTLAASLSLHCTDAEARKMLTFTEVKSIFIGTPWRGPGGTFHFRTNGTYTYSKKFLTSTKTGGPWRYTISADGTVKGKSTHYQFFRKNNGRYEYFHTRSGRYFKAQPQ